MAEPALLVSARQHLSQAERDLRSGDGLYHLEEGLALLEELILEGEPEHKKIAANLLSTYSTRICEAVRKCVEVDPALPEPELEHLFRVLLAFDAGELKLPDYVRSLKIDVVKRLIDLYYEGHPGEQKLEAFRQLAGIASGRHKAR